MPKSLKNEKNLTPPPPLTGSGGTAPYDLAGLGYQYIMPTIRTIKSEGLNPNDVLYAETVGGSPESQNQHLRKIDRMVQTDSVRAVTQRSIPSASSVILHFATAHNFVINEVVEVAGVTGVPSSRCSVTSVTALTATVSHPNTLSVTGLAASGGTVASVMETFATSPFWHASNNNSVACRPQLGGAYSLELNTRCQYNNNNGNVVGLVAPVTVTFKARTSNIATLTTAVAHGFVVGQRIKVTIPSGGSYSTIENARGWSMAEILSVPTTTTLTFASVGTDQATTACGTDDVISLPFLPGITLGSDAGCITATGTAFHKRSGSASAGMIGFRNGSYAAPILPFFTCTVTIAALPEATKYASIGQISAGYGFGLRVRSAGEFDLVAWDGGSPTVLATPGAVVAAGDAIHLAKFGNMWRGCITSGNIYGIPKASSSFEWWKRSGVPGLGYPDIFGETAVGLMTDSVSVRMDTPRFTMGG